MEVNLPAFLHSFTACACGHGEHIGHGLRNLDHTSCPECDAIAGVNILTIVPIETAEQLALNVGSRVRYGERTMAIVSIDQVTKLWGKIGTEFVRVVMAGPEGRAC